MSGTGYILNGIYHRGNIPISELTSRESSMDKQYRHDAQRREHRRDLIQPYKDGKPNPEFIVQYPQESKDYGFTPKE